VARKDKDREWYWPRRGDFADHVEWFLEKNPTKSREEAIEFAKSQMGHQIAISRGMIRNWEEAIRQEKAMIVQMEAAINGNHSNSR